ncbi:hypothetical protein [Algibacter sp. L3A6]|nr:hypothetical protein [Algibacter sp. L3A6]
MSVGTCAAKVELAWFIASELAPIINSFKSVSLKSGVLLKMLFFQSD